MEPLRRLDAGQAEHRGREINERNQAIRVGSRGAGGPLREALREPHEQRDAGRGFEQERLAAGHAGSVIGVEEDDRGLREAVRLELVEDFASQPVSVADVVRVAGVCLPDRIGPGIVGGHGGLRGIVPVGLR